MEFNNKRLIRGGDIDGKACKDATDHREMSTSSTSLIEITTFLLHSSTDESANSGMSPPRRHPFNPDDLIVQVLACILAVTSSFKLIARTPQSLNFSPNLDEPQIYPSTAQQYEEKDGLGANSAWIGRKHTCEMEYLPKSLRT